jgi:hypothetical protein
MSEQAAPGGANEGAPELGDVRFEGDVLLTFDGTSWIPMARSADTGGNSFLFRKITAPPPSGPAPAARSEPERSTALAAADDPAGSADSDAPGP